MKNIKSIIAALTFTFFASITSAQFTLVYETGNTTSDPWTGWTSTTTSVSSENVNGVNFYIFTLSGGIGTNFSIEISRGFNITGTPINVEYSVFAQSATLELLYSEDNVNWTSIDSDTYGATFSSSAYLKSVTPMVSNYYLMLRLTGTVGNQSQANFSKFSISESNANTIGIIENDLNNSINISDNVININYNKTGYTVSIYNLSGQLISSDNNLTSKDLSSLESGVYFINITTTTNEQITKKVIIR